MWKATRWRSISSSLNLINRLRLMERIAEPLDFAHARGFLHRDLKPENIMIGAFGEVLIMDWGLAKVGGWSRIPANRTRVRADKRCASRHQ